MSEESKKPVPETNSALELSQSELESIAGGTEATTKTTTTTSTTTRTPAFEIKDFSFDIEQSL